MTCCVGTYNLCINQGATYLKTFTWLTGTCCGSSTVGAEPEPVDLTGYTAAMQIRAYPGSSVLYDASADLTLGGPAGTIALDISTTDTEGFTWLVGVYDLLLTSASGVVTKLLEGSVTVNPVITT